MECPVRRSRSGNRSGRRCDPLTSLTTPLAHQCGDVRHSGVLHGAYLAVVEVLSHHCNGTSVGPTRPARQQTLRGWEPCAQQACWPTTRAMTMKPEPRAGARGRSRPRPARVVLGEDEVLLLGPGQPVRTLRVRGRGAGRRRPTALSLVRALMPGLVIVDILMPLTPTTEGLEAARESHQGFRRPASSSCRPMPASSMRRGCGKRSGDRTLHKLRQNPLLSGRLQRPRRPAGAAQPARCGYHHAGDTAAHRARRRGVSRRSHRSTRRHRP
ncbi:MAG: hypothetical protein JWQ37_2725 [Blastococcus sp.]|nr:hypothetical protein [Blastococcus sp.]